MRTLFLSVTMIAGVLAGPAIAQITPSDSGATLPSILAPRMPEALPPPTPLAPEATEQQQMPRDVVPAQTVTPASEPPELGTVTAVPLPPPGDEPSPAAVPPPSQTAMPAAIPPGPALTTPPNEAAAVGSPIPLSPTPLTPTSLTPTSLAPPPFASPTESPNPGTAVAAKFPAAPIVSARLPTPPLSSEASPADFLRAAWGALAAGRNGEARSALEMAQTRLLGRSVDAGQESVPSHDLAVKQISEAINALVSSDRMTCLRYIEFASRTIGSPLD